MKPVTIYKFLIVNQEFLIRGNIKIFLLQKPHQIGF